MRGLKDKGGDLSPRTVTTLAVVLGAAVALLVVDAFITLLAGDGGFLDVAFVVLGPVFLWSTVRDLQRARRRREEQPPS